MRKSIILFFLFSLAACGTSPEPRDYGLVPVNGATAPDLVLNIKVQRPSLPNYLDRPQMVRLENFYEYKSDEWHRWAEPLDRMFERILTIDLRQRLPQSHILAESDTGVLENPVTIDTAVQQFNEVGNHTVILSTTLSMNDKHGASSLLAQSIELTSTDESLSATVSALSNLIGSYADHIVQIFQARSRESLAYNQ